MLFLLSLLLPHHLLLLTQTQVQTQTQALVYIDFGGEIVVFMAAYIVLLYIASFCLYIKFLSFILLLLLFSFSFSFSF